MKKLLLVLLLLPLATMLRAQGSVTFTLVTTPCDTNGVLVAHLPATGILPFSVYWNGGSTTGYTYHYNVHGYTDTLYNYTGSAVSITAYDSTSAVYDTGTYPSHAPFTVAFDPIAPFCGAMTPVSVTVTGGTPPYAYSFFEYPTGTVVATTNPAVLTLGMYGINVTDATGCQFGTFSSYSPIDSIGNTPTFSVSVNTTPANCTNGTATATVLSGGTPVPPFTYAWSDGATTAGISGLIMGSYNVTVTDAAGCIASGYGYVEQSITISVATTPSPATCLESDGAIIAFGSGGLPPYSYIWSNGATTQSQSGITSGAYYVAVTDANGCLGNGSGWVSVSTPISVTYTSTPSLCTAPTGTATLAITGGTPPYHDTFYASPIQTGLTASGLGEGTYYFRVVDALGCVQSGSVVVPPIDEMYLGFSSTAALCTLSTGSLSVSVTGGVSPLAYHWSTGATTPTISGLPTGGYYVTVTDANSCVKSYSGYVPDYSPVSVGMVSTPASCLFASDGVDAAVAFGGTAPYNWSWSSGATTSTASGLPAGYYYVNVWDASGCFGTSYNWVGYNVADSSCFCTIKGNIYYDMNGNCTRDAGEPGIHNIQVYCSGIGYTYTDDSGNYSFLVPSGTYTITETVLAFYPLSSCQPNNIVVTASAAAGCVIPVNFANSINPIHSVHISTWDYNYAVPGNVYTQAVLVTNEGTVSEPAILGGYKTDGQLFSPSFTPSGIFTLDSTNWYTTPGGTGLSLDPGTSQFFYSNYNVPTFIPLGTNVVFRDSVAYLAPMANWLLDYSPWDNVNYFNTTIVSSYDPNFKEVSPKGTGPNGNIYATDSVLEFMVHFQNTGTYMAQNITVIDTLSANLDWATLRPVYQSAPCKITLSTNGIATFKFENIDLPAASYYNNINSNGMFSYTVKLRDGLALGSQIKNKASIYFDYNAPIVTNTTLNTLVAPAGVAEVFTPNEFFTLYPNPAGSSYNLSIHSEDNCNAVMVVSDLTGRSLQTRTIAVQQGVQTISASTETLTSGIYFVTLHINGKSQTQKLVVVR